MPLLPRRTLAALTLVALVGCGRRPAAVEPGPAAEAPASVTPKKAKESEPTAETVPPVAEPAGGRAPAQQDPSTHQGPQAQPPSAPKPAPQPPAKPPYAVPDWQPGQSVTYHMQGEGSNSREYLWTIAVVGKQPGGAFWLEMRLTQGEDTVTLKMLTTKPTDQQFRTDPTRVLFGVSNKHRPQRMIIHRTGAPEAVELDLTDAPPPSGPNATVPPTTQWQFDAQSAVLEMETGRIDCRRFYVSEPGRGNFFEAWHSPDIPVTGLARMRSRQADGQRFQMDLVKIRRQGAKSTLAVPIKKMSEVLGDETREGLKEGK